MKLSNVLLTSLVASTTMTAGCTAKVDNNKSLNHSVSQIQEIPEKEVEKIKKVPEDDSSYPYPPIHDDFYCPACGLG